MHKTATERAAVEVRVLLARRLVTQNALAQLLGINPGSVSRRMRGEVPFTLAELDTIAQHFGVPVASLLGESVAA